MPSKIPASKKFLLSLLYFFLISYPQATIAANIEEFPFSMTRGSESEWYYSFPFDDVWNAALKFLEESADKSRKTLDKYQPFILTTRLLIDKDSGLIVLHSVVKTTHFASYETANILLKESGQGGIRMFYRGVIFSSYEQPLVTGAGEVSPRTRLAFNRHVKILPANKTIFEEIEKKLRDK